METKIKGNIVRFTPAIIQDLEPTFSTKGRRFSYQPKAPFQGFKDVSLNDLIVAIKNTPIKTEHTINEIKAFIKVFERIKNKGYGYQAPFNHQYFLIRLITRIKHFFSNIKRNKILKDLSKKVLQAYKVSQQPIKNPKQFQFIEPDDEEPKADPKEPFNFLNLPEDMQFVILSQISSQSLLSVYRTSNKSRALVEKRLSKELKKAQLKELAYIEFQKVFSAISSTLDLYPKQFVALTHQFAPSYSKELLKKFKKAFIRLNNPDINLGGISVLIQASKDLSLSHPKALTQLLEQTINIQEVLPRNLDRVADCIKIMASFDPKKAISLFLQSKCRMDAWGYNESTIHSLVQASQSHLNQLFEAFNEVDDEKLKTLGFTFIFFFQEKLGMEYLPLTQKILDASQTFSEENRGKIRNHLAAAYSQLGEFDKSMEMIKQMQFVNQPDHLPFSQDRLKCAVRSCVKIHKDAKDVDNYLQQILLFIKQENVSKQLKDYKEYGHTWEDIIIEIAQAYASINPKKAKLLLEELDLNQLQLEDLADAYIHIDAEKAKELSKRLAPGFRKNALLMEMAKSFAGKDAVQVKAILNEMNLPQDDNQLVILSKTCASIDVEKAKEIANQIMNFDKKIEALLEISDFLKKVNLEAANDVWEYVLNLSLVFAIPKQLNHIILNIVRQKAEIDPNNARKFLGDELIYEVSLKNLFIETAQGNMRHLSPKDFISFASLYAKLYPVEAEKLIKSKDIKWVIPPMIKAQALLAVADAI